MDDEFSKEGEQNSNKRKLEYPFDRGDYPIGGNINERKRKKIKKKPTERRFFSEKNGLSTIFLLLTSLCFIFFYVIFFDSPPKYFRGIDYSPIIVILLCLVALLIKKYWFAFTFLLIIVGIFFVTKIIWIDQALKPDSPIALSASSSRIMPPADEYTLSLFYGAKDAQPNDFKEYLNGNESDYLADLFNHTIICRPSLKSFRRRWRNDLQFISF
jgi:hypothetical protein